MTAGAQGRLQLGQVRRGRGDAPDRGRARHALGQRSRPCSTGWCTRSASHPGLRPLEPARDLAFGGAPTAPETIEKAREVLPIEPSFSNVYGLTETHGVATLNGGKDLLGKKTSAGRPFPFLDMKIIDESGQELPDGQHGELPDLRPHRHAGLLEPPRSHRRRPCATAGSTRGTSATATPTASTSWSTAPRT